MRRHFTIALLTLTGCAPSATWRQCEFINAGGLMPVARRYNFSGYYGCAADKALIPVLVKDHDELGVFDFKTRKITLLDRQEPGVPPVLSPDGRFVLWTAKDMTGRREGIGPKIRVYEIASKKKTELTLPEFDVAPQELRAWFFSGFSEDGRLAMFQMWAADSAPRVNVDLERAELFVVKKDSAAPNHSLDRPAAR